MNLIVTSSYFFFTKIIKYCAQQQTININTNILEPKQLQSAAARRWRERHIPQTPLKKPLHFVSCWVRRRSINFMKSFHLTQWCTRLFGHQTRDVLPNRKWSLETHVQSHKARCEMKDRAVTKDAFNCHWLIAPKFIKVQLSKNIDVV